MTSSQSKLFFSESDLDAAGILSPSTRWRLRRCGQFPEPVSLSKGRKAYPADAINKWIAERMEGYSRAA